MPRNSQGLYALPSGNPVIPGTLIESGWANNTMSDVGDALTNSLPRNGVAPMTGPLILQTDPPTQPRHATSKAYVDSMLTYATGLPIGTVVTYAGSAVLSGFLLCNGQAISRTTYADLFGTIGTIYGAGDGSNTFNLPDLQNQFIRGKGGNRTLGSVQAGMVGPHGHAVTDPIHTHGVITAAHSHTQPQHAHTISDPGHAHTITPDGRTVDLNNSAGPGNNGQGGFDGGQNVVNVNTTGARATGISVNAASTSVNAATQSVSIAGSASGVTVATSTGTENVPSNIALDFWIKAVQDVSGPVALTGIDTSDHEMISVDVTLPNSPMLVINSNVPYGTVKLDSNGKVPLANSQSGIQTFLGLWDASTGNNPSEENPFVVYANGDTFLIGVGGTIDLFDPATELESPTLVEVGDSIVRVSGSAEQPDGWYFIVATGAGVVASDVKFIPQGGVASTDVQAAIVEVQGNIPVNASELPFTPAGTIAATNAQAAIAELDGETQIALGLKQDAATAVAKTSVTGAAMMPVGTQAQRPSPVTGHFRFNSDTVQFEGYNGLAWAGVISSDTPTFTGVLTTEQKINVTQPYGVLQVSGADVLRFGSDNSGQLAGFRNILINGDMRINQRGVTIAAAANGAYGPDRWKKVDASNMTQIVEAGNFIPSATYTLSGTGVTTQQLTSPASGNWTLPNIPIAATNVQLEEGSIATPFEHRPIGLELSLCQSYYETGWLVLEGYGVATQNLSSYAKFAVRKRAAATMTVTNNGSVFMQGTFNAVSISVEGARIVGTKDATAGAFLMSVTWTASAEL